MKARYTKRLSARLIAALLSVLLAAGSLPGCAAPAETEDDGRMKVVTTIFPQYDFVRAIGGDLVHLRMLLSPGEEMHSYEPTPLDIREIQACDLFIYVGGENDVWVERILENMGGERPQTLSLLEVTDTLAEEIVERDAPGALMKSSTIIFENGSRIIAVPGKPDTVRGFSADIWMDEFAFFEDPAATWKAILPSISNPLKGLKTAFLTSTPNGKSGRGKRFYDIVTNKGAIDPTLMPPQYMAGSWSIHRTPITLAAPELERKTTSIVPFFAATNVDSVSEAERTP